MCALLVACWLVRSEMRHSFKRRTHDRLFVNSTHGSGPAIREFYGVCVCLESVVSYSRVSRLSSKCTIESVCGKPTSSDHRLRKFSFAQIG